MTTSSEHATSSTFLQFGSLFSGIGGLDLGLERAGMKCIWQSEIDPFASRVLAKHWPNVPNLGDVTEIDWSEVERPDLICGGYPCQPFSVAGERKGTDDERHLWPYFAAAIRYLRPRFALLENVTGHLSLGFGDVMRDLAELGYDCEWEIIRASAVGAPHARARLLVVAHAQGEGLEGRVFSGAPRTTQCELPAGFGRAGTDWPMPPAVSGVGYGLPDWMDRVKSLGNAVVPDVAEYVGRRILEAA